MHLFLLFCFYIPFTNGNYSKDNSKSKFFLGTTRIIPTAAIVSHEPGVPPGWPSKIVTPPLNDEIIKHPNNLTSDYINGSNYLASQPEALIGGVNNQNPNKGFVDWILNAIGLTTTPKPIDIVAPKDCIKCECGVSYKHNRIVGGVETQVNAYPWMVALMYNGRFYCGASVISNKYLLTAAHCVNNFPPERLTATFLEHDRSTLGETKSFKRKIRGIIKHKSYGIGGNYNNDIALLKIDEELKFNGLLRPVCLPPTGKSFTGYKGIVTGWGATMEHGAISDKLLEVDVPIMSNIDCRKTGYGNKITENMMCAGYPSGMKDSCQGDSGGPLHVINSTIHTIVGIVSWGDGCAAANYPGVYTRVNRYISWIKINTRDSCYC